MATHPIRQQSLHYSDLFPHINSMLSHPLTANSGKANDTGCKIYNHIPPQIKKISNNVALFKTKLKKFLLQYIFYSVDEYYQQNYNDYDC